jgi:choline dehydrogenase/4-pyridoxate dehydrogenase
MRRQSHIALGSGDPSRQADGRERERRIAMPSNADSYDYIIVGAGSAGCTLANRLTEDPDVRVLILEAGGSDRSPLIAVPLGWGKIVQHRYFDWGYFTEPEPNLDNREVECARGRVVGGCSSINATAYVRGHRADYDRWAASGLAGWSYADVLPYFKKQEDWTEGADTYRGAGGPLTTIRSRYADPLAEALMAASESAGHGTSDDYNGARNEGTARAQFTVRNGRRCSAAVGYLRPALQRGNLTLHTGALALRVVVENGRAFGIEFASGGETKTARVEREVILAGGVINSPQLLMLSGIGDPAHLRAHGIDCIHALPGVGRNLQDHLSVGVDFERNGDGPFVGHLRYDRIALAMAQAYLFGTGFATEMPGPVMGFFKSDSSLKQPDIQLLCRLVPPETQPWFPGIRPRPHDAFMLRPVLLHPESRGEIRLKSADPRTHVAIHQNFLSEPKDLETLRNGITMMRDLAAQNDLDGFRGRELQPGANAKSQADLDAFIRRTSWTVHHPLGTCKMGTDNDDMAVVDTQLRVRGMQGLRVVDASVMPDLVGGNINAPVIMIAEKAADVIRGRPALAPAQV